MLLPTSCHARQQCLLRAEDLLRHVGVHVAVRDQQLEEVLFVPTEHLRHRE